MGNVNETRMDDPEQGDKRKGRGRLPAMTSELKIGTRGPDEYLAEQGSVRVVHADSIADA